MEVAFRKLILLDVTLQLPFSVGERNEPRLSERAIRENAAGNPDLLFLVLQLFRGLLPELFRHCGKRVRVTVERRIGIVAEFPDLVELLDTDLFEWVHYASNSFFMLSSIPLMNCGDS